MATLTALLPIWLGAWGLLGLVLMCIDKHLARHGSRRVSERSLHSVALAGGFAGIFLGSYLFRHKVSKFSFWPPVVLALIAWAAGWWLLVR